MEHLIGVADKELITELNTQLLELINTNTLDGRKILSIVVKYPNGYRLPKVVRGMVKEFMVKYDKYLMTYGDICDTDKTDIDELKEIL